MKQNFVSNPFPKSYTKECCHRDLGEYLTPDLGRDHDINPLPQILYKKDV